MRATLPLMSSSRLDVVEQCISSGNDVHPLHHYSTLGPALGDQDSARSVTLQSILQFLDRDDCHDEINGELKERICICTTGTLAACQSEAASVDEGAWNSSTNLHETLSLLSQPLAFQLSQGQLWDQEYGPRSQDFVNTLSDGVEPPGSPLSLVISFKRLPCDD
ncbi:hypothetical protein K503DRAFT_773189 [Rhizopogon vinicolor AM-OR11-026]|uniref:Uncharacterized protein n=1 Tax=Rhizopogon vinicolor AM-OR11-026 TaxID=1314800 RepID=A0A1B7MSW3_9AGAM|nr:hypothetical protein K503DRAFT_773189 [Rhizopogon vinicolor AM-OR11-026]